MARQRDSHLGGRPLNLIHMIFKMNSAAVLWPRAAVWRIGQTRKVGQLFDSAIDLKCAAAVVGVFDMLAERAWQLGRCGGGKC